MLFTRSGVVKQIQRPSKNQNEEKGAMPTLKLRDVLTRGTRGELNLPTAAVAMESK